MASRADYLSKYLSSDATKPFIKEAKGPTSKSHGAQIFIEGLGAFGRLEPSGSTTTSTLSSISSNEPGFEFEPVEVEPGPISNSTLSFKRIDNGELVSRTELFGSKASEEYIPKTIYRDSSGKIVDLQAKKIERKLLAERCIEQDIYGKDRINMGELDTIKHAEEPERLAKSIRFDYSKNNEEYLEYMAQKNRFEDPLSSSLNLFENSRKTPVSATEKPIYMGGMHPENRFQINAGYFWDGIDRGNGFEERLGSLRGRMHVNKVTDKATQETYTEYDFD